MNVHLDDNDVLAVLYVSVQTQTFPPIQGLVSAF